MGKIREDLKGYLAENYLHTDILTEHSLAGEITIRFNSSESNSPNAQDRITQCIKRATLIWHKLFDNSVNPLWVIAYEYLGEQFHPYNADYFVKHFSNPEAFEVNNEVLNTRSIEYDTSGNALLEKAEGKILVGRVSPYHIDIESLLSGIANLENGIAPAIGQIVYFLNPINHTGFHMFDDRAFFVWANEASKIRDIYLNYNEWISEYSKEDIDSYFV